MLEGDKDLLLQMVVNLVENSIHHCPRHSSIVISGFRTESGVPALRVCDNGPGIAASEVDRVFERLYRLEASRTTKGSGLGLSLVKAVVELHDGEIQLTDNKPGLCATVRFAS